MKIEITVSPWCQTIYLFSLWTIWNYFNNSEICSHSEFFINHENTLECLQINWSQITLNSLDAFVEDCVLEEFANTGI